MKESELEKMCIEIASLYSTVLCSKIKASGQKHSKGGQTFFKKSSIPGFADLLLCIHGKYIEIELKSDKGIQSPVQKIHQSKVEKAGGMYYIVRSINEFKQIVDKYI